MANTGEVFDNQGSKPSKNWKYEEKLLILLLELFDGEYLALIKVNEIDMTELMVATEALEELKQANEPKEEEELKVDKEAEKEKVSQGLNKLNEDIYWNVEILESVETATISLLKIKFNKYFKIQMKNWSSTIEEPQYKDTEQLDPPRHIKHCNLNSNRDPRHDG